MAGSGTDICSHATTGKDSVSPPTLPRTSVLTTEPLEADLTTMLAGRKHKPHSGKQGKNKAFSLPLATAFSKYRKSAWKYLNYCSLAEFFFEKSIFYNLVLFVDMGPE